jgi:Domain of unknown function (DUF4382)
MSFLARLDRSLRGFALAMVAAVIGACGGAATTVTGGGPVGGNDACSTGCGTALLTITDAPGDFLSYTIDVTSLQLKKANGVTVQTLPVTSRIDFAQLVDLDEVLSAGQIPAGSYVSAALNVDYSNASIVVDDGTGAGVTVSPVNASGAALGQVTLNVELDNRNHLVITPGRVARLAFDLNLAASNTVDLAGLKVTVSPFIVASVVPPETRETRVRGRLASVDVAGSSYTVDLRPFHERASSLGQVVVQTTSTTTFEINGAVSTGAAGLSALAGLTDKPLTIAFGTLTTADHSFTARRVLAGSSIEDAQRDHLSGNVLSRAGNTLTVGGVRLDRRDGRFGFERGTAKVTVGPDTKVTREGQGSGSFSIADISVGQRIHVMGVLGSSGSGPVNMDATAGRVRLAYTRVFGTVKTRATGALTVALQSIDGREPAQFNFTGTGASAAQDADPANYDIGTGVLDTSGLGAGAYARLFGFVSAFGTAPPDFRAETLVDFTSAHSVLGLSWGLTGSTSPFPAISATGITVDLAAAGLRGAIELGGRLIDVHTLATGLALVPATQGNVLFAIAHRAAGRVENFSTFGDFTARLSSALTGSTAVMRVVAKGRFDAITGAFSANQLLVVLSD